MQPMASVIFRQSLPEAFIAAVRAAVKKARPATVFVLGLVTFMGQGKDASSVEACPNTTVSTNNHLIRYNASKISHSYGTFRRKFR